MSGIGYDLIGVIVAGLGTAAVLYAAMHALRKAGASPARWILPAGIGLAMIIYSIWNDYSWLGRTQAQLPDGTQILLVGEDRLIWAPWTYLVPVALRFAALDPAKITDQGDGIRQAPIMLVERHKPVLIVVQQYNCAKGLTLTVEQGWQNAEGDPAMTHVCPKTTQ